MGALKSARAVGTKAGRVIVYKVADVAKMFAHWRVPLPHFMEEICNGKVIPAVHIHVYNYASVVVLCVCVCVCVCMYM